MILRNNSFILDLIMLANFQNFYQSYHNISTSLYNNILQSLFIRATRIDDRYV